MKTGSQRGMFASNGTARHHAVVITLMLFADNTFGRDKGEKGCDT
jgi:hypothetical protein